MTVRLKPFVWTADLPVWPVNSVAHEDVHQAQIIRSVATNPRLAAVRK